MLILVECYFKYIELNKRDFLFFNLLTWLLKKCPMTNVAGSVSLLGTMLGGLCLPLLPGWLIPQSP